MTRYHLLSGISAIACSIVQQYSADFNLAANIHNQQKETGFVISPNRYMSQEELAQSGADQPLNCGINKDLEPINKLTTAVRSETNIYNSCCSRLMAHRLKISQKNCPNQLDP